tara:strand:+ start:12149 stop:13549 length:1401 start_codon:yes stop_codon:yes gene_type:complete
VKIYDLVVIGSGPGGYVCAIRASQLGIKTAIIEKYSSLGGTCLNVGCIPSKALLDSSHHYHDMVKNISSHGINVQGKISLDFKKMIERKNNVVSQTVKGIDFLMNKNNIDVYTGFASFVDDHTINIENEKKQKIKFKKCVIATGSKPATLPFINIDKQRIITSTEALSLCEIPKSLTIIGAGVIGLELGQVYNRLGSEVNIIEYSEKITPFMDNDISKELLKIFKKEKINFYLSSKVFDVNSNESNVIVKAENKSGEILEFVSDYCLVSVGRKPYTENLGLGCVGVNTDKFGKIIIDKQFKTTNEDIFAIGDVVNGPMLAHKAEEEGIAVAEILKNHKPHIDYNLVPNVIYTWPEVSSVGKTEQQLIEEKINYKKGSFPMRALGRSRASNDLSGFVKILADKKTDEILGVHIIGARAADLITEAVIAMEFKASCEDIAMMSHPHPTYSEGLKEAALAALENRALHI